MRHVHARLLSVYLAHSPVCCLSALLSYICLEGSIGDSSNGSMCFSRYKQTPLLPHPTAHAHTLSLNSTHRRTHHTPLHTYFVHTSLTLLWVPLLTLRLLYSTLLRSHIHRLHI